MQTIRNEFKFKSLKSFLSLIICALISAGDNSVQETLYFSISFQNLTSSGKSGTPSAITIFAPCKEAIVADLDPTIHPISAIQR